MLRGSFAIVLFALAAAHVLGGTLVADADTAMIVVHGASGTTRWLATQALGASIAGYAVAGLATLRVVAPESWRAAGVLGGAAGSFLLTGLLWRTATWAPVLAVADSLMILALAQRSIRANWSDETARKCAARD